MDAFGIGIEPRDVGFVNKYVIDIEEGGDGCPIVSAEFGCFEITFTTNFQVSSHTFSAHDKILQFDIDSSSRERKYSRDYYSTRSV